MSRKKWTPQEEGDESLNQFREKRKWQIALRRYVLEKNKSSYYAPFFGLDIQMFREWIAFQFDETESWDNFSKAWQFEHIVPVAYFDFEKEEDMRLCWNFTNIRVDKTSTTVKRENRLDTLAAYSFFTALYEQTGYPVCRQMAEKIRQIEEAQVQSHLKLANFIKDNKDHINALTSYSSFEYDRLNTGTSLEDLQKELNFLKKFGT